MFLFANTSYAGSTTVVNAGSDSGAFHQMLTMISEKLDNSNYIQANNPVVAGTHFDKGNVLTVWSTEWPGDSSLPKVTMDENTIIGVTAYETILCSRTYNSLSDMSGEMLKISTATFDKRCLDHLQYICSSEYLFSSATLHAAHSAVALDEQRSCGKLAGAPAIVAQWAHASGPPLLLRVKLGCCATHVEPH